MYVGTGAVLRAWVWGYAFSIGSADNGEIGSSSTSFRRCKIHAVIIARMATPPTMPTIMPMTLLEESLAFLASLVFDWLFAIDKYQIRES